MGEHIFNEKKRIKIIIDLINLLTNNNYDEIQPDLFNDIAFTQTQYRNALKRISKKSLYFENENECSMVSYLHALHVNMELIETFGLPFQHMQSIC